MVNALILAPFDSLYLDQLRSRIGVTHESWTETQRLIDPDELIARINKQDIGIVVMEADFIFEEVFEGAPGLRFIGVCRSSVNNVDIDAATSHGVLVANTPGRNSIAVAELTIGLLISLARHIPAADSTVKSGKWTDPTGPYITMRGTEIFGKTAGVIGFGAIGAAVSKRLQAFGMKTLVYDPFVSEDKIEKDGAAPVALDILMRESDVVSIHCSANEKTCGLITPELLGLLKPTALLINTAGWDIIDEKSLLNALQNRLIAGAAFDIFATHPLSPQSPLMKLDNVILTPHIGGATDDTVARYSRMLTTDIIHFLNNEKPLNLLNPQAWEAYVS